MYMYICMYKGDTDNKIESMALKNKTYSTVDIQVNYSKIGSSITLMWDSGQVLDLEYLLQCRALGFF